MGKEKKNFSHAEAHGVINVAKIDNAKQRGPKRWFDLPTVGIEDHEKAITQVLKSSLDRTRNGMAPVGRKEIISVTDPDGAGFIVTVERTSGPTKF